MKTVIISFLFLATAASSFAQGPDTLWTRTYGGSARDWAFSVQQTADGGYVVAGKTESFGAGRSDVYLVKTDSKSDTIWTRTYGGGNYEQAFSVQQTTDGGYVVVGSTYTFAVGWTDVYLVKTDSSGNSLWQRTYGGVGGEEAVSVQQTADKGYIVAGWTCESVGYCDFYLVKTDSSGNMLWDTTYGGSNNDEAYCVHQTTDGGYIVVGATSSFGAGGYDFYLVKTDSLGGTLWTRTYGGSAEDIALSVQQTTDGGYIVAGRTGSFGAGGYDCYLVKTDSLGDTLWTRTYGGVYDDGAGSVQQTIDGGYVLSGSTESFGAGEEDFYLIKTNASGDTLWTRTYGGAYDEGASSVQQTIDEGYIAAGHTVSFGAGEEDFYVVKTGPEPNGRGFISFVSPGPPDWAYRLHCLSGYVTRFNFANFCVGTVGSVSGSALVAGWSVANYTDSIVFQNAAGLAPGSIETFWLSHPFCSDRVAWRVGDSSGFIDGPLPVELLSISAAAVHDGIEIHWNTASETDNDYFEIMRGTSETGAFSRIATLPSSGNSATGHHYEYLDREVTAGRTYWYYLADVDISGNRTEHRERMRSASMSGAAEFPKDFALSAHPNPFNPSTTISFALPEAGLVQIAVYDVSGRWIETLVNENRAAGNHSVTFDARDLPSGVYFARMESGPFTMTKKMLLIR